MPNIYDYFGLIFFIIGGDHQGVHVHVRRGKYQENKYIFSYDNGKFVGLRKRNVEGKKPLDYNDDRTAQRFIILKHLHLVKKFNQVIIQKDTNFETIIYHQKIKGL